MALLLDIAGIVFIALILIAGLMAFSIVRKWRRFRETLTETDDSWGVPRIHLEVDAQPEWMSREPAGHIVRRLAKADFASGRAYTIPEMPSVRLTAMFHAKTGVTAAVYEHDQVGVWVDLGLGYEDGEEITVSNVPTGGEMDHRPEVVKVTMPGASLDDLAAEMRKHLKKKPRVMLNDETFARFFEESYAKDMEWRMERGGVTEEEIRRVAASSGMELTDEQMAMACSEIKSREIFRWHKDCLGTFRRITTLSVYEYTSYLENGDFFVLADRFDPEAFLRYLEDRFELSDEHLPKYREIAAKTGSPRDLLERINRTLVPDKRARQIGSVVEPMEAEIWFMPSDDDRSGY